MILLQVADTTNVNNIPAKEDVFLFIEAIIIIAVIIYQIYHSIKVYNSIELLRKAFDNPLRIVIDKSTSADNKEIVSVNTSGKNEIITRIKNTINSYLVNNYGAVVNFSIIKDIIDREIDVKDEEISQSVPTPLYLGLAATMLGIIFGLFSMPDFVGSNISGISALINGVKFAMGASLTGLLCTTVLSSFFYKRAKKKILQEINEQLSYLQAKLLPELIKAEDTGVSGLKQSLDHFAREAIKIADNVHSAALQTDSNIKAQQDVLAKVENLNMTKVSKVNLELFSRLENNMAAFNKFSKYLSTMEQISVNLKDFACRTTAVDDVIQKINSAMQESKDLSRFLTTHFEKIESSGNEALKAVDFSDSYFKAAIEILTVKITESISKLNATADTHEIHIREIYEDIGKKLNDITSKHLDEFKAAYSNAVPQFQQLDHLETLVPIKESLDERTKILLESKRDTSILVDGLTEIYQKIPEPSSAQNSNNQILEKITEIYQKIPESTNNTQNTREHILEKITEIYQKLSNSNTNESNIKNLANAINKLSLKITGDESTIVSKSHKFGNLLKYSELILRIIAWGTIISYGIHSVFNYFNIL